MPRSGCPINLTLEVIGDRWSLIVLRDIIFRDRRHYGTLLNECEERIATNVLADRLKRLVEAGLLSKADDPSHRQKAIYSLTEPAIQLIPLLAQLAGWGVRHTLASDHHAIGGRWLHEGGPRLWERVMDELRHIHLGRPKPPRPCISELRDIVDRHRADRAVRCHPEVG